MTFVVVGMVERLILPLSIQIFNLPNTACLDQPHQHQFLSELFAMRFLECMITHLTVPGESKCSENSDSVGLAKKP
jgi:hypothetical protein